MCHNTNFHLRRSQTLQPIRIPEKRFLLEKYFESQHLKSNYANIEPSQEDLIEPFPKNQFQSHHHHNHNHNYHHNHNQSLHARSQSQHSYHTMRHDLNNYYNLSNNRLSSNVKERPIEVAPGETPTPQITPLEIMHVCNELQLGNLDSPPPLPARRNYTVHETDRGYFKMTFCH